MGKTKIKLNEAHAQTMCRALPRLLLRMPTRTCPTVLANHWYNITHRKDFASNLPLVFSKPFGTNEQIPQYPTPRRDIPTPPQHWKPPIMLHVRKLSQDKIRRANLLGSIAPVHLPAVSEHGISRSTQSPSAHTPR